MRSFFSRDFVVNTKLRPFFIFNSLINISLFAIFGLLYFQFENVNARLMKIQENHFQMIQKAQLLESSSENLTKFARMYVVTDEIRYKENYFRVLDIRNGKAPRPKAYSNTYWNLLEPLRSQKFPPGKPQSLKALLKQLPYSKENLDELFKAEKNSNKLVDLEIEAFNAMRGLFKDKNGLYTIRKKSDQAYAIKLLFSQQYNEAKQEIMQPINHFFNAIDDQTQKNVNRFKHQRDYLLTILIIFGVIFLLYSISNIYTLYIKFIKPILKLQNLVDIYIKEGTTTKIKPHRDEIGKLAKSFYFLTKKIAENTASLKQSIDDIKKSQALLNNAQKTAKLGSWSLDISNNHLEWSDEIYNIFEIDKEKFHPSYEGFLQAIHPLDTDRVNQVFQVSLENKEPYRVEHRLLLDDGRIKYVIEQGHTTYNDSGEPILSEGTVLDITELKTIQIDLEESIQKEKKANASKSEFLANMSHEIRTPLNAILGFVEQVAKRESNEKSRKQLEIIKNSGHTLLGIVNDILDYSKIESGKLSIDYYPVEITPLLNNTLELFKNIVTDKNITLHIDISKELPPCVETDGIRVQQVIFNILSNATKFTPEKGEISTKIYYDYSSHLLHCEIQDSGIGIAKENLSKIFKPFDQADTSTTRKFGGTGLGLSICSMIAKLMHGNISVLSEVGKGSIFHITLKMEPCENEYETIEEEKNLHDKFSGRVLIVEDNKTNQMLLGIILNDLELSYEIANNGIEAVKMYQEKEYDLIMMDENMPEMNGIEATRHIRLIESNKSSLHIPIVAVTANAMSSDKQRFLDAGMDDYISKPFNEHDILTVISKFLQAKIVTD